MSGQHLKVGPDSLFLQHLLKRCHTFFESFLCPFQMYIYLFRLRAVFSRTQKVFLRNKIGKARPSVSQSLPGTEPSLREVAAADTMALIKSRCPNLCHFLTSLPLLHPLFTTPTRFC